MGCVGGAWVAASKMAQEDDGYGMMLRMVMMEERIVDDICC